MSFHKKKMQKKKRKIGSLGRLLTLVSYTLPWIMPNFHHNVVVILSEKKTVDVLISGATSKIPLGTKLWQRLVSSHRIGKIRILHYHLTWGYAHEWCVY